MKAQRTARMTRARNKPSERPLSSQRRRTTRRHPPEVGRVIPFPSFGRRGRGGQVRIMDKKTMANVGAIAFGAIGVGLAELVGIGQIVVGAVAAYAAYRVIRYGVAPTEALLEGVELEHGEVPRRTSKVA